jgi:SOS-response transcriptional repressor LexA/DNA-binding XRE family transcriptional regulator
LSNIQQRIIELRKSLGIEKVSIFAEELGIKRTTIIGYEDGSSPPSAAFLVKIREIYNININWLLAGVGEMFLSSSKEEKHPLVANLEAMIDQRLEKIEAQIAEIKGQIKVDPSKDPDSGLFVSEPEPEYGEDREGITYVEGIAAGKPIFQSEARSTISVPKRYIKTKPEDYYAGRIKGTSMTAAGIPDGVLVLIRISDTPRDGAIQVVEHQGEATLKRMREVPGKGWKICFDDHTGRYIEIGPEDEFHIQGDFVAILPEHLAETIR